MRQAELTQQRRLHQAALPALPAAQLESLRGALRSLAITGWHGLVIPLHRSRSREAAGVLRRYRDLRIAARADEDGTLLR
jgi:hypothetical protein